MYDVYTNDSLHEMCFPTVDNIIVKTKTMELQQEPVVIHLPFSKALLKSIAILSVCPLSFSVSEMS